MPYHAPMPVYLDQQPAQISAPTLGQLLAAARQHLAQGHEDGPPPRVVVEIAVDGQPIPEAQLNDRLQDDIALQEVHLTTADPRELAVQTLRDVQQALTGAQQLQQEAADLLQQDQTPAALQKVGESIESWLQVQQAVLQSTVLLAIDLDQLQVDGQPAHSLTTDAVQQLQDIKTFIQANDTVALADALQYEWPEITQRWHTLIDTLVTTIEK